MYINFTPIEKAVIKTMLLNDLVFFIRFFFKEVEGGKFLINWHHKKIADKLMDVYNKKVQNLIINIPPRHSKTTMLVYFTAWCLAKNPKALFLYISQSDKLTNSNSRLVRQIITSQPFVEMFGFTISKDSTAKNHWRTNQNGGITTATINGQITGFGAGSLEDDKEFMGGIIIDDPNKPGVAGSEQLSEEPNERFNDTIRSRRNGKATPVIVVQQRVFPDDLSGFLLNGGGALEFEHLCLPVLVDGKPLWPQKMDLKEIREIESNHETAHIYKPQYEQKPENPEGMAFSREKLSWFKMNELNKQLDYIRVNAIDTADSGDDDYADIYGYVDGSNVYIVDVVFSKEIITTCKNYTAVKCREHHVSNGVVEVNREGSLYISNLRDELPNVSFHGKYNSTNKIQRILAQEAFILQRFRFRSDYEKDSDYDRFMTQLNKYNKNGKSKHDDAADVCALLAWYVRQMQFIK